MRKSIFLYCFLSLLSINLLCSQTVIVTDDSTYITGQTSAVLELKSTTKGFLPPRVTSVQKLAIVSPATGLLVYQTDATAGYYLWTGTRWDPLVSGLGGNGTPVIKTVAATLLKTETFVLASNDIILTLPVIVSADNGLSISVKNIGTYTDLVQVKANGTATIDGTTTLSNHTRWHARTYVAYEGNWLLKEKVNGRTTTEYEVSPQASWTTIPEALAYLAVHMIGPSVLRLGGGTHFLSATQVINLPYFLNITGLDFRESTISPAAGLAGSPMFSCASQVYFRYIKFDATALANYGTAVNEDAIWLTGGSNLLFGVESNEFRNFNKALVVKNNMTVSIFRNNIFNSVSSGIEVAAGATSGLQFKVSETNFVNCTTGINFLSALTSSSAVGNCTFLMGTGTQVCINYVPATYATFTSLFISNNIWNIAGFFLQGFDFTRSDGRDANAFIENNTGDPDHNPNCKINVINNSSTTTLTNSNTWYKASWTNTSSLTSKWAISGNRITFLSINRKDGTVIITGNLSVAVSNKTITIALIKNGVTATPIGETSLRITASNQPFQFSTVISVQGINKNDYFELWCQSASNNDVVKFQDIQWLTETK
jgi:hypothetical protein